MFFSESAKETPERAAETNLQCLIGGTKIPRLEEDAAIAEDNFRASSPFPDFNVKELANLFRWLVVNPDLFTEFSSLRNSLDKILVDGVLVTEGVSADTLERSVSIFSEGEFCCDLPSPLLSMVIDIVSLNKFKINRSANKSTKKSDSMWDNKRILISSKEGRILSFDGRQVEELDMNLDYEDYGFVMVNYKGLGSESIIFLGTHTGNICTIDKGICVYKSNVGSAITCIEVYTDAVGESFVFVGDNSGYVTILRPNGLNCYGQIASFPILSLWEKDLETDSTIKGNITVSHAIRSITSFQIVEDNGHTYTYTIICAGFSCISLFSIDEEITRINLPYPVKSMTRGFFEDDNEKGPTEHKSDQILILLENDFLYLLWFSKDRRFEFKEWAKSDNKISKLKTLECKSLVDRDNKDLLFKGVDFVLCTGYFCGIEIWTNRRLIHSIETKDWVWDLVFDVQSTSGTDINSIKKSHSEKDLCVRLVAGLWNNILESHLVFICGSKELITSLRDSSPEDQGCSHKYSAVQETRK